ncbi:NADH dehydrogenase subunit 9 (mitochondrion) [Hemiselmis andersenii]|uniref:NADH dehydrogenase subunit 9 n=1 Tax=Hemiselmis andersenii TaxID=464988 RepID=B2MWT9_HEMAN|nr:NADH dehydrogenase subunit 9 [Hemiselmis andersenii]ACC78231.1 NADH dehydrogenase subunit 9 [Hemiselmis andersenii]
MFALSLNSLYKILKYSVICIYYNFGEVVIEVEYNKLKKVIAFLKGHENCLYKLLVDIVVIDCPENPLRFKIVYLLCSVKYNLRIKVVTRVDEITPVSSITDLYKNAGWMEREGWDMYGIYFEGHPDLRRILTDYGFEGYPLRKDFPLSGYKEVRYDDSQKRVIFEPLEMSQEFRIYQFTSPWYEKK